MTVVRAMSRNRGAIARYQHNIKYAVRDCNQRSRLPSTDRADQSAEYAPCARYSYSDNAQTATCSRLRDGSGRRARRNCTWLSSTISAARRWAEACITSRSASTSEEQYHAGPSAARLAFAAAARLIVTIFAAFIFSRTRAESCLNLRPAAPVSRLMKIMSPAKKWLCRRSSKRKGRSWQPQAH